MSLDMENLYRPNGPASSGDDKKGFRRTQDKSHDAEHWVSTSDHRHDRAGRFHMAERIPRASWLTRHLFSRQVRHDRPQ